MTGNPITKAWNENPESREGFLDTFIKTRSKQICQRLRKREYCHAQEMIDTGLANKIDSDAT